MDSQWPEIIADVFCLLVLIGEEIIHQLEVLQTHIFATATMTIRGRSLGPRDALFHLFFQGHNTWDHYCLLADQRPFEDL